jgi:hypothetical protein
MSEARKRARPGRRTTTAVMGRSRDATLHPPGVGGSELNPPALIRKLAARTPLSVAELAPLEEFLGETSDGGTQTRYNYRRS